MLGILYGVFRLGCGSTLVLLKFAVEVGNFGGSSRSGDHERDELHWGRRRSAPLGVVLLELASDCYSRCCPPRRLR
jgi:hypothetical protein